MSRPGRNDPCPCGSGKKYKHCHLGSPEELVLSAIDAPAGVNQISEKQARELLQDARLLKTKDDDFFDDEFDDLDFDLTPLEEAWEFIDEAWFEPNGDERRRLGKMALKRSKDCAGAYLVLGQTETKERKRIEQFTKAISVAKKVLAPATLEDLAPGDWSDLEVESAMFALIFRAIAYYTMKSNNDALNDLKQLIQLDPSDRLSAYSHCFLILLDIGREEEAEKMIRLQSPDGVRSPIQDFARALVYFRRYGDSIFSRRALADAMMRYPEFVFDLIRSSESPPDQDFDTKTSTPELAKAEAADSGRKPNGNTLPPIDESTDLFLIFQHFRMWATTDGAEEWISSVIDKGPRVRYENEYSGAGPMLFLAEEPSSEFLNCPSCRHETHAVPDQLVLKLITGKLACLDVPIRHCTTCDLKTVQLAELTSRAFTLFGVIDSLEFIPIGFIPESDQSGFDSQEATPDWLRVRTRPFRSLADADAARDTWPTLDTFLPEDEVRKLDKNHMELLGPT